MAVILRVCEWPGCHRAARSQVSKYCPRHRPWCATPGCPRRALADHIHCGAHDRPSRSGPKRIRGRQRGVPHEPLPVECTVDGCDRRPRARALCWRHYRRLLRSGTTADPFPAEVTCRLCAERRAPGDDGLCREHRRRVKRYGDPFSRTIRQADRVCINPHPELTAGPPAWRLGLCSPCYWQRRAKLHPRPKRATTAPAGQPSAPVRTAPDGPTAPTGDAEVWYRRARAIVDTAVKGD